jgi:hypothetical protein
LRTNWAGNVEFSAAEVRRPASIDELQSVVRAAPQVRALGPGQSFNRIADTGGVHVSTENLALEIEIDTDCSVATVPGGTRYAELSCALQARGLALNNLGSLPHISIAGAVRLVPTVQATRIAASLIKSSASSSFGVTASSYVSTRWTSASRAPRSRSERSVS